MVLGEGEEWVWKLSQRSEKVTWFFRTRQKERKKKEETTAYKDA